MTQSCEIDNLKKNIDDAKMKLDTEMKVCKLWHIIQIQIYGCL